MDEESGPEARDESSTPVRDMAGAAEDLSSLFGGETPERTSSATALGPRRPEAAGGELSGALGSIQQRLSSLERSLADAVSRIQAVDRHLATTFQGLQAIFDRLRDPSREQEIAGAVRALTERLAVLESEVREHAAAARQADVRAETGSVRDTGISARLASIEATAESIVDRLGSVEARLERRLDEGSGAVESAAARSHRVAEVEEPAPPPAPAPSEASSDPEPRGSDLPGWSISLPAPPDPVVPAEPAPVGEAEDAPADAPVSGEAEPPPRPDHGAETAGDAFPPVRSRPPEPESLEGNFLFELDDPPGAEHESLYWSTALPEAGDRTREFPNALEGGEPRDPDDASEPGRAFWRPRDDAAG